MERSLTLVAVVVAVICLCRAALAASPAGASAKTTVGWLEKALVLPGNVPCTAKLDTGARTSSINTRSYELFDRGGAKWVKFVIVAKDKLTCTLERRVLRFSKIKEHGAEAQARPVVMLEMVLGDRRYEVEVNLVDRSNFIYPLLLGRSFLQRAGLVVDASARFTRKPSLARAEGVGLEK